MLKLADLEGLLREDPSGLLRVDHIDSFLWRQLLMAHYGARSQAAALTSPT
jgi:hypothetical protein